MNQKKKKMLRQILKRVAIRNREYAQTRFIGATSVNNLEVKINQQNETFEVTNDAEVEAASGKHEKLEFPFVWLRDNCQVSIAFKNAVFFSHHAMESDGVTQFHKWP